MTTQLLKGKVDSHMVNENVLLSWTLIACRAANEQTSDPQLFFFCFFFFGEDVLECLKYINKISAGFEPLH